MKNNLLVFLLAGTMLLLGSYPASAVIMFDEVLLGTTNPTITDNGLTVEFSGDAFTEDGWTPGDAYLASGFDPNFMYDTFIGASAVGFKFESVSFDIVTESFLPPSTTFGVQALSGSSVVDSFSLFADNYLYHTMNISFATGFDSLYIWDDLNNIGLGEFFHIDNFSFTEYEGTQPIPEPSTIITLCTGLAGIVLFRRKLFKK